VVLLTVNLIGEIAKTHLLVREVFIYPPTKTSRSVNHLQVLSFFSDSQLCPLVSLTITRGSHTCDTPSVTVGTTLQLRWQPSSKLIFKFRFFLVIKSSQNATCIGSSNFCIQVWCHLNSYSWISRQERILVNYSYFPKRFDVHNNSHQMQILVISEFVIQNTFGIWICYQKESCSFMFILPPHKIW
jgi:hypothetical protein